MRNIYNREEKNCIGDDIEMILSPGRYSFRWQRDGLPDNMDSLQYFQMKEDSDLLNTEKMSILNFSAKSR